MRKTMVLLTGGMDSTWALWKVMRDTGDEAYAFYCDLHPDGRGQAERVARAAIVHRLETVFRPIRMVTAFAVKPQTKTRSANIAVLYAATAAAGRGFGAGDRIVTGRNASDDETEFTFPLWWPKERRAAGRERQTPLGSYRQAVIDMIFEDEVDRPSYERLTPFPTREQMIEDLPSEILDLTIACSNPRFVDGHWMPCGRAIDPEDRVFDGDGDRQCFKCAVLAQWLPRYRPENGWACRQGR